MSKTNVQYIRGTGLAMGGGHEGREGALVVMLLLVWRRSCAVRAGEFMGVELLAKQVLTILLSVIGN